MSKNTEERDCLSILCDMVYNNSAEFLMSLEKEMRSRDIVAKWSRDDDDESTTLMIKFYFKDGHKCSITKE